jgi:hypothetical protein
VPRNLHFGKQILNVDCSGPSQSKCTNMDGLAQLGAPISSEELGRLFRLKHLRLGPLSAALAHRSSQVRRRSPSRRNERRQTIYVFHRRDDRQQVTHARPLRLHEEAGGDMRQGCAQSLGNRFSPSLAIAAVATMALDVYGSFVG